LATTRLSSREFNQDTGRAKRAARKGPVIITERGRPAHVLLTFEAYQQLGGPKGSIIECLGEPAGVENIDLEIPVPREPARPANLH
jgi:prevent-host-death family protein